MLHPTYDELVQMVFEHELAGAVLDVAVHGRLHHVVQQPHHQHLLGLDVQVV